MSQADTTLRSILMLTPFATRPKHVDSTLREKLGVGLGDRKPGFGTVFSHRRPLDGTKFTVMFDRMDSCGAGDRLETVPLTYSIP